MWPSVAVCLEALEMKTRAEALHVKIKAEALHVKIHIFFSPLKPLQMMSGRFWPCVFEFAPKAPRNSYLFAPKARQNHVWPFVFHFLNSPLNPAEIEIRVEALEIKI